MCGVFSSERGQQLVGKQGVIMEADPEEAGRWIVSLDGLERPVSFDPKKLKIVEVQSRVKHYTEVRRTILMF